MALEEKIVDGKGSIPSSVKEEIVAGMHFILIRIAFTGQVCIPSTLFGVYCLGHVSDVFSSYNGCQKSWNE